MARAQLHAHMTQCQCTTAVAVCKKLGFRVWCRYDATIYAAACRFEQALHRKPDTLDELKAVLNTVNRIRNEGMIMELRYTDLEERYRTRQLYAIAPEEIVQCETETEESRQVRIMWQALSDEADSVDFSLEETKKLFSATTRKQVSLVGSQSPPWMRLVELFRYLWVQELFILYHAIRL